jgi:hypothetical protein
MILIEYCNKYNSKSLNVKAKYQYFDMMTEGVDIKKLKDIEGTKEMFKLCVSNIFRNGSGLRKNALKSYTGKTLELLGELALIFCLISLKIDKKDFDINDDYLKDHNIGFDEIRLDQHLYIKNKLVLFQEDRAWIDKPFAILKYQVAADFYTLPYDVNKWEEIIIPFLCYSYDVLDKTFTTRNYQFKKVLNNEGISENNKYGVHKVQIFNLSGKKRDVSTDYFSRGFSIEECDRYVECVYNHINEYKKIMND